MIGSSDRSVGAGDKSYRKDGDGVCKGKFDGGDRGEYSGNSCSSRHSNGGDDNGD